MLKRIAPITLALLLATATVVMAAGTMGVTINGKAVTFKTAPEVKNNTLMVPLDELVGALGIEAKWNLNTNTLEITDTRTKRIEELQARVKELESKTQATSPSPATPSGTVTKDNLVKVLQEQFGTFKANGKHLSVTWRRNTATNDSDPLFVAEFGLGNFGTFNNLRGQAMLDWFNGAAKLIAQVYPKKSSAVLLYRVETSSVPTVAWDRIDLNDDFKWEITEYLIWSFIADGVPNTDWDD